MTCSPTTLGTVVRCHTRRDAAMTPAPAQELEHQHDEQPGQPAVPAPGSRGLGHDGLRARARCGARLAPQSGRARGRSGRLGPRPELAGSRARAPTAARAWWPGPGSAGLSAAGVPASPKRSVGSRSAPSGRLGKREIGPVERKRLGRIELLQERLELDRERRRVQTGEGLRDRGLCQHRRERPELSSRREHGSRRGPSRSRPSCRRRRARAL